MSANKKMIESIREYFTHCELLKDGCINVDYLGLQATQYSIDPLTSDPIVQRYTDGGSLRQYQFAFTSTEHYSQSDLDNIENSGFYEDFADWIETQNKKQDLPVLDGKGITAQCIETLSSGYLFSSDETTARYQIQCRLLYNKEV